MTALVLALCLSAAPPFEGELEFTLTTQGGGGGTITLSLSARGLRSDVDAAFMGRRLKTALVVRAAEPSIGIALDPAHKTAQRFDLSNASEAMRPTARQSKQWSLEKLGVERVLQFSCDHVRISDSAGFSADYWVTRDLVLDDVVTEMVNRAAKQPASVEAELHRNGVRGLVVKMAQKTQSDDIGLELKRVTRKAVSTDALSLEGYTLTPGVLGPNQAALPRVAEFNSLSDEQKKALSAELRANYEAQQREKH